MKSLLEPNKIAICLPSGDYCPMKFTLSFGGIMAHPSLHTRKAFNRRSCYVQVNRCDLVDDALAWGADWLLFLDSDMTFPPYTLERLLSAQKDVVCATYVKRVAPHEVIGEPDGEYEGGNLRRMKKIPAGVLLINADVFKKLERPYFHLLYVNGQYIGEDFYFCDGSRRRRTQNPLE